MENLIVVKLGGSAGIDWTSILDEIASLWPAQPIIFVHGANAALDAFIRSQGKEPRLVTSASGQTSRFTNQETMDDFLAVYAGRTNKRLVEALQARGVDAVGLSGIDGGVARGVRHEALRVVENGKSKVLRGDYSGSLTEINSRLLSLLLENGYLPVVTPPALSIGGEAINVDGDKLAMRLAITLQVRALVILSNTRGLLADLDAPDSLIQNVNLTDDAATTRALAAAHGRMKKKVLAGMEAVRQGVPSVVFGDARIANPITAALQGKGTVLSSTTL